MGDTAGQNGQVITLYLPEAQESAFRQLEQVKQEQVVFDAWRRALQDWQHQHHEKWRQIDKQTTTGREVEVVGWEVESINAGVPDLDDIAIDHGESLSKLENESRQQFVKDVAEHMVDIIDNRFRETAES